MLFPRNIHASSQKTHSLRHTAFTSIGSVITKQGRVVVDDKTRILKYNAALTQFCPVWKSTATKLRIFNTNVKAVLLYGSETWKVTMEITKCL